MSLVSPHPSVSRGAHTVTCDGSTHAASAGRENFPAAPLLSTRRAGAVVGPLGEHAWYFTAPRYRLRPGRAGELGSSSRGCVSSSRGRRPPPLRRRAGSGGRWASPGVLPRPVASSHAPLCGVRGAVDGDGPEDAPECLTELLHGAALRPMMTNGCVTAQSEYDVMQRGEAMVTNADCSSCAV